MIGHAFRRHQNFKLRQFTLKMAKKRSFTLIQNITTAFFIASLKLPLCKHMTWSGISRNSENLPLKYKQKNRLFSS